MTPDRIVRGRGTLVGCIQILAMAGWERDEIMTEIDKVFEASNGGRTYLVGRFDVTGLSEAERDRLALEVAVQAEASDADEWSAGHPDVEVVITFETSPATPGEVNA